MARVELRDGTPVEVRPIEPADREALAAGYERLSTESRERRFFTAMPKLTEKQLDFFTQVDHTDHEALVAVDPETGEGMGVARYIRIGSGTAEPAITVADEWTGRGVAALLLDTLVKRAREEGIGCFCATVLAGNEGAVHSLSRLGETEIARDEGQLKLKIAIDGPGAGDVLRRALRTVAQEAIEPVLETAAAQSGSAWRALASRSRAMKRSTGGDR